MNLYLMGTQTGPITNQMGLTTTANKIVFTSIPMTGNGMTRSVMTICTIFAKNRKLHRGSYMSAPLVVDIENLS